MRALSCIMLATTVSMVSAQDRPASLLINGGLERREGWVFSHVVLVPQGVSGKCAMVANAGGLMQQILPPPGQRTFSCSAMLKTEEIVPTQGPGYAYLAIYQLNAAGQYVAFRDFAQVQGTHDWQRFDYTFELVPEAQLISVRCGLYNCSGKAWFDNWTLVPGPQAFGFDEVEHPDTGGGRPSGEVAVFRQEGFPVTGAASSPDRLGRLLANAGLRVTYLSAAELADPKVLNPARFNLVVLPYGQSFPASARLNMIDYLHRGGAFISTGGYVFNRLLLEQDGQWRDESAVFAERLQAAMAHSLLPDGDFETTPTDAPVGGTVLDGQWRRDGDICTVVSEQPKSGARCAKVTVSPDQLRPDRWYLDIPPERGVRYRITGWMRTENVRPVGAGMAYMALYEYKADGSLGTWRDFGVLRGTHDWTRFQYDFTPAGDTTRLHIKMGLYQATGTAWFDDIRLVNVTGSEPQPMNTSTGQPMDGLVVAATQIGAFDASYPLRRVSHVQPAAGQYLIPQAAPVEAPLAGWAAAGIQGNDDARWVELVSSRDRFGRERGPVAALMIHYDGFYGGSMWGFFGVENRDLFDGSMPWLDQGLVNIARFIVRGVYLRNLKTDLSTYRDGETVRRTVFVENQGSGDHRCQIVFRCMPEGDPARASEDTVEIDLRAGETATVESPWSPDQFEADIYRVTATLFVDGEPIDEMETGFVVQREQVARAAPELRFRDNYFQLGGRPLFLFGSDDYAKVYGSAFETPWTWHLDHVAARDFGFNLYENLQYSNPDYTFSEAEWRAFEGMAQLTQREGLVFMPCQLVGHNVAIGDDLLERQAAQCREYGARMRRFPALLYYLNGDFVYRLDDPDSVTVFWNRWLADKYGTPEALRESWGDEVYGEWGSLSFPPPPPHRWDSPRECDRARFDVWLTTRWVERHVAAVRSEDPHHPITSEYYSKPSGGLDLLLTIDGQDVSNIGYFDLPERDIDLLPLHLRLNDLRLRGKSVSLGEYGVKTHPAWTVENGATGYHIVRTEEQQKQLFMAVAHYALGMGACKVQNWCLRDASQNCFPWGVFYPNGRVPKDVAYWHRNLSLVWRFFAPRYETPPVAVLIPDGLRLGAYSEVGVETAFNAFRALLADHAEFACINESHIEALSADTRLLIWPSPFCPDDASYRRVLQWVRDGGVLILTGDISRDWNRQRTRTERLRELCGVEFVRELFPPPYRAADGVEEVKWDGERLLLNPCVEVRPVGARVLAGTRAGVPLLVEHSLGSGRVLYCTDPLETGNSKEVLASLQAIYRAGLRAVQNPLGAASSLGPDVHLCRQRLQSGGEFVMAFNTNLPPNSQDVALQAGNQVVSCRVAARYPALAATNGAELVAVGASGEAKLNGQPLLAGDAQIIALSLDGQGLPQSSAVLLCPFSTGSTTFFSQRQWADPVTVVGGIAGGQWRTYEVRDGLPDLILDEDLMTTLLLLCERSEVSRCTELVGSAVRHPETIRPY